MWNKILIRKILVLFVVGLIATIASIDFVSIRNKKDSVVPAPSYSYKKYLSDYEPSLKDSYSDSPLLFFDSGVPGDTIFVMGGTHPNESAGILSTYIVMENLELERGRVIVLPIANHSASTNGLSGFAYPSSYALDTPWGKKEYKVGSRLANPLDQWPDPVVFKQYPSGQNQSYEDARNLNRNYPGRDDGVLIERVGNAILTMLSEENVKIAFDLHEASITYPVNQTYIAPEKCADIAFLSSMFLSLDGLDIRVEISNEANRGYSHSEWGRIDGLYPFLIEVPTPFIDRTPGVMSGELITKGQDDFLYGVAEKGFATVDYPKDGITIDQRCGMHLSAMKYVIDCSKELIGLDVELSWPMYQDLVSDGIGFYLHEPDSSDSVLLI